MIPAYRDAKCDRALRGAPLTVYLDLLDTLTVEHYRPLPQLALCVRLGYSERTVRWALRLLTRGGYLRRRAGRSNGPREYRLVYERTPMATASAAHPQT